jgi:aryl-alcohol dehydrogenase-like predicted oxidoreductase
MAAYAKLPLRQLGTNGPKVPRLGLGLMSMNGKYGTGIPIEERLVLLDEAYKMGEIFWDTGKVFSMHVLLSAKQN